MGKGQITVEAESVEVNVEEKPTKGASKPVEKEMSVQDYLNEKVTFRTIFDGEKYKDDIIVTINGKNWQIKRGVDVQIPRYVYMALEDAERQKIHATNVSQGFENQYKDHVTKNMM